MKRFKRITAIVLCIVFTAMLASLCVFSFVHCPDCCPCESCRVCLLIHSATATLRDGCFFSCAVIVLAFASVGCEIFRKRVKQSSHETLVTMKIKLTA